MNQIVTCFRNIFIRFKYLLIIVAVLSLAIVNFQMGYTEEKLGADSIFHVKKSVVMISNKITRSYYGKNGKIEGTGFLIQ